MSEFGQRFGVETGYLAEVYARSSDAWEFFELSGQRKDLAESAGLLCEGLEQLLQDAVLWAGMHDLPREVERRRAEVGVVLERIELLLAVEERVLTRFFEKYADKKYAGSLARRKAIALVRRAALSIASVRELPTSAYAIEGLRQDVTQLQGEVCAARDHLLEDVTPDLLALPVQSSDEERRSRFWGALRVVGRGLFVVGGATVIAANGAAVLMASLELDKGLASGSFGLQLMNQQFGSNEPSP